jgi:hypothetical protein
MCTNLTAQRPVTKYSENDRKHTNKMEQQYNLGYLNNYDNDNNSIDKSKVIKKG